MKMKKISTLLCLAALSVVSAHGASVLWALGAGGLKTVGALDPSTGSYSDGSANLSNATLYFLLGSTSTADVKKAFGDKGLDVSSLEGLKLLDTASSNAGGAKAAGSTPVSDDAISTGKNAFSVIAVTSVDSTYFFKLLSGEQSGYDPSAVPAQPKTTMNFSANTVKGVAWTAVPEPATAALALLGLGLMIKRRKA